MIAKNVFLYFLGTSLFYLTVPAQAGQKEPPIKPGYLGKRMTLSYNLLGFPSYVSGLMNSNAFNLQLKHSAELDYVTARRVSLGLGIKVYSTIIPFYRQAAKANTFDPDNSRSSKGTVYPSGTGKLSAVHGGVFLKLFGKRGLAPLGTFGRFQVDYIFYNVKATPDQFVSRNARHTSYVREFKVQPGYGAIMPSIGLGHQRILNDKILISAGFQVGWVFGGLRGNDFAKGYTPYLTVADMSNNYYPSAGEYVKVTSKAQLYRTNFLNATLGIGFVR